jgi:hypothetical protein
MRELTAETVSLTMHSPTSQFVIKIADGEYAIIGDVLVHREEGSYNRNASSDLDFHGNCYADYRVYCVCIDESDIDDKHIGVRVTNDYRINSAQDALIQVWLLEELGYGEE